MRSASRRLFIHNRYERIKFTYIQFKHFLLFLRNSFCLFIRQICIYQVFLSFFLSFCFFSLYFHHSNSTEIVTRKKNANALVHISFNNYFNTLITVTIINTRTNYQKENNEILLYTLSFLFIATLFFLSYFLSRGKK